MPVRRKTADQERGQVLMLVAILLAALLGLVGLVVDTGHYYSERRQTQNASDQAALAAAHELDFNESVAAAKTAALQNAAANGFDNNGTSNTVTVNIPPTSGAHIGDANYTEVIIDEQPKTFFIHVLVPGGHVKGRGVAGQSFSKGGLFATDTNCGNDETVNIKGANSVIGGSIHSNGSVKLTGSNNQVLGAVSYVCSVFVGPTDTVGSGPRQVAPITPPINYSYSDFTSAGCLFNVSGQMRIDASTPQYWLNNDPSTLTLKSGIYCATGQIELLVQNVRGTVTFASQDQVKLGANASGFYLLPFWNGVFLFSSSSEPIQAIEITGINGRWSGYIHAPNGGVKFNGPGHVAEGDSMVVSRFIEFDGGATVQFGTGILSGGVSLVE